MKLGKNAVIWLLAFIFLSIAMSYFEQKHTEDQLSTLPFSEFMNEVENKKVANVVISGSEYPVRQTAAVNLRHMLRKARVWLINS